MSIWHWNCLAHSPKVVHCSDQISVSVIHRRSVFIAPPGRYLAKLVSASSCSMMVTCFRLFSCLQEMLYAMCLWHSAISVILPMRRGLFHCVALRKGTRCIHLNCLARARGLFTRVEYSTGPYRMIICNGFTSCMS